MLTLGGPPCHPALLLQGAQWTPGQETGLSLPLTLSLPTSGVAPASTLMAQVHFHLSHHGLTHTCDGLLIEHTGLQTIVSQFVHPLLYRGYVYLSLFLLLFDIIDATVVLVCCPVCLMSLLSTLRFPTFKFFCRCIIYLIPELFFLFIRRPRATGVTSTGLWQLRLASALWPFITWFFTPCS